MKTQFSFRKSGFTLVELMVVISILAMLFYVFSRTSFQSQEYLTKAERLANKISSVLHDGLLQLTIGRMDGNTPPAAVTGAVFNIGTANCIAIGSGISWYYTPALNGSLRSPFFDNDPNYSIDTIEWEGGTMPGSGSCIQINMTRNVMTFSGISDPSNTIVTITARYFTMKKKVTFDRRTGRIEVNKN